ncbi:MAG: Transcriptional regulator, LacI family [Enterovirga sp.]|nr:Transcriptional regulator, LacI family [Enterovirga sp.]
MSDEVKRKQVKLRDVAEAAGVAVGTVSRVLNDNPTVNAEVRRKVQAAIDALGYELDIVAQSLRGGSTRMVACAIRDFDIPQFASYIKEAERIFRENGYTLLLSSTTNKPDVEVSLLRAFGRRRVDGIMMTVSDEAHKGVAQALEQAAAPVLLIDRDHVPALDRVMVDHYGGAKSALEYLLGLGHRRVGLLVGDTKAFPSRSRVQGFQDAHSSLSLTPDPGLVRMRVFDTEDAFRETMALMSLPEPPTALLVAAMDTLGGSLRALRALGQEVGRDVSLVAGSDSELAELYSPAVTAIRWDLSEMGRHAATMLLDRMRGQVPLAPRALKLPTTLIIRDSCRPPARKGLH